MPFVRTIGRWMITSLVLTVVCLHSQGQTTEPLTVSPYHNLPTTEGYFEGAGGVRLFYRVAGRQGDPIVFLHGSGGGLNIGGYDMEPLAERGHRLLMFNERGAGRSEIITDATKLRIDDLVQDVEAFRERFGLDKFDMIGVSWGSAVALKYITRYPQRVSRVVFLGPISPTFALYQERLKYLNSLKTEKEREQEKQIREKIRTAPDSEVPELCNELFQASHREYVVDTAHLKRSRQDPCAYPVAGLRNAQFVFQSGLASLGEWDFRSDMKKVKVPALVLEGAETHVPLSEAREWVKSLPDARFLLIPDAGHAIFIDQPEAVISAMDEFFRGNWPAGAAAQSGGTSEADTPPQTRFLNPDGLNKPMGYTHVVVAEPRKLVYVSGQVAWDANGEIVGKGDIRVQVTKALENLKIALAAAGATTDDLIKVNYYVVNLKPDQVPVIREVRTKYFSAEHPPASTLVGVTALAREDFMIEIEAVAAVK